MDDSMEINPENLPQFTIPEALLDQLYSFTGGDTEEGRGMILAFVSQDGSPAIMSRTSTQVVEMGLRKAIEQYLAQLAAEGATIDYGLNSDQEGD